MLIIHMQMQLLTCIHEYFSYGWLHRPSDRHTRHHSRYKMHSLPLNEKKTVAPKVTNWSYDGHGTQSML